MLLFHRFFLFNQVFKKANGDLEASRGEVVTMDTIAWWRMNCGRVMGVYDGRLIEYERSTLAPLGLVVGGDELIGRKVIGAREAEELDC